MSGATRCCIQVIWIVYNPARGHYDALLPLVNVSKVEVMDLQKQILHAAKEEARQAKLRARKLRPVNVPMSAPPAEAADMSGTEVGLKINA
jgi:hypothetical protein